MRKTFTLLGCAAIGALAAFAAIKMDGWLSRPGIAVAGTVFDQSPAHNIALEQIQSPVDFRAAAKKIMPSVVSIDVMGERETWMGERYVSQTASGSGVIISHDGYILTNNHVVAQAQAVRVRFSDGRNMEAKVIGTDSRSDLAVIKADAGNLIPVEIGSSKNLDIGQWVLAVGNPLGYEGTVSVGVISSLNRTLPTETGVLMNAVQTDAAINPGNSGGALADAQGRLVGINTAIANINGGNIGIGFAIPVDRAKHVVDDIIHFGHARYGELGLGVHPRSALLASPRARRELADMVGADPPSKGLIVREVTAGGPAAQAGIHQWDILLSIDGKALKEPVEFLQAMMDKKPGEKTTVKFWTRGNTKTATVVLQDIAFN